MSVIFVVTGAGAGPGSGAGACCNANAVATTGDISYGVVFAANELVCGGGGGGGDTCCGGGGGGAFGVLSSDTDAVTGCDLFPRAVATAISADMSSLFASIFDFADTGTDTGTDVSCGSFVSDAWFPRWVSSSDFSHRAIATAAEVSADLSAPFVSCIGADCRVVDCSGCDNATDASRCGLVSLAF